MTTADTKKTIPAGSLGEEVFELAIETFESEYHPHIRRHVMYVPWMRPHGVVGMGAWPDQAYRNLIATLIEEILTTSKSDLEFWLKCYDDFLKE